MRPELPNASAGIETTYSLSFTVGLNCGFIAVCHSFFMISLIPALLRRSHFLSRRDLQAFSKASSIKIPPQRPPEGDELIS